MFDTHLNSHNGDSLNHFQLLEDHLQKLRDEDGITMNDDNDDEAAWQGWDVESDSSDESESEGWIDVEDNNETLNISDSEDEGDKVKGTQDSGEVPASSSRISTLATTKVSSPVMFFDNCLRIVYERRSGQILTPADFALLNDLRIQEANNAVENGGGSHAKRKLATLEANKKSLQTGQPEDSFISENDILGPRKKAKSDYAERMASIQKGREGREKFRSNKGKVNKETPSSSTNREKARNKPIMMILSSGAVRGKKKASLREKQQKLRAHIEKAKKARH